MAPNKAADSKLAGAGVHGVSGSPGKTLPVNFPDDSSPTLKPVLSCSDNAELANVNTGPNTPTTGIVENRNVLNNLMLSNNNCKTHSRRSAGDTRIEREIQANNDLRRRIAVGEIQRRIAIEAAIHNLGQSHEEAVELVTRLKELNMDLGNFVKSTSKAKKRSLKPHEMDTEGGVLGNSAGKDDGSKDEGNMLEEGEEENIGSEGDDEWRLWCE